MTWQRPGRRAALPADGLREVLTRLAQSGNEDSVTVREIVETLGPTSTATILLIPAILALSPATAILGIATFCGLCIAILSAQLMMDRQSIWLPSFIMNRHVPRAALKLIERHLAKPLLWIEKRSRVRLTPLMRWPWGHVPGATTFLLGLAMPILEFVPPSATLCGAAVTLMVLGLLLDDGLLVALGMTVAIAIVIMVVFVAFLST